MKVSLVVATGAHEGRVIPLTGPQFLIGRDQQCHLRPASQAISKLHCAVVIRDGRAFVKDFGSTNGTLVNGQLIQSTEVEIADGATLRVGPLDFIVQIEKSAEKRDGTPLPGESGETAAALAAVKAVAAGKTATPRDTTPNPVKPSGTAPQPAAKPAPKPAPAKAPAAPPQPAAKQTATPAANKPGSGEAPALKAGSGEVPSLQSSETVSDEDHDRIAAMLLGMDEEGNSNVPDGSTVMDIPTPLANDPNATGQPAGEAKPDEKKEDGKAKVAQTREEMSNAANDLLRKYMRRPK